jgi:UDP-glucose 4-epimerase
VTLFDKVASQYAMPNQQMVIGDIADRNLLLKITEGIDYVYHFAGLADIDECSEKPREAVLTNILGTVDLLEACRNNAVKRFVFASSAYVFSNLGGFYKSSKRACENLIADYHEKYGLDYVVLRFGSLYGLRSNEKNGLFKIIKALLTNEEYTYDGTGEEIRELINVFDAAKISVDCLDEQYKNSKLLVTGIERLKMRDVIDMVNEILGRGVKVNYNGNTQFGHYKITPYSYDLGYSYKIINNPYVDIGQGIIQVIQEIVNGE